MREVGDRLELAEIVRPAVVCTMKGSPVLFRIAAPSTVFRQAPRTFLKRS